MEIIDAQIHNPSPQKPFDETVSDDMQLAIGVELAREAVDSVRVDKAVVFAHKAFNEAAVKRYPELFGAVQVMDHAADDLEAQMAAFKTMPGMLGLRTLPTNYGAVRQDPRVELRLNDTFLSGGFDRYWALAEKYDLPMFFSAHNFASAVAMVAERHPALTIIIDHFGITQSLRTEIAGDRWEALPRLLEMARYPNVYVKCCGTPLVSREPYPFDDVWPHFTGSSLHSGRSAACGRATIPACAGACPMIRTHPVRDRAATGSLMRTASTRCCIAVRFRSPTKSSCSAARCAALKWEIAR